MKKILCFGDSNTYGFIAGTGQRYSADVRWTSIIKTKLIKNFEVIEAGCNNRNGFTDSIDGDNLTGYKILPSLLRKNNPNIVILALGINDLQKFYNPSLEVLQTGLDNMIKTIKNSGSDVIVITPPVLNNDVLMGGFSFQFDKTSVEKSKLLPEVYSNISKQNNVDCIDLNKYVSVSSIDGLHYSSDSHKVISDVIFKHIVNNY